MDIPVIAEIWTIFEASLQMNAKRLVEDIAKSQHADFKELWSKVRKQTRVSLLDIDLPDPLPTRCPYPSSSSDGGAVKVRCRAPCLLGFDACPKHAGTPMPPSQKPDLLQVDRVLDCTGQSYFVDPDGIARDRNGRARGAVVDGVLMLFEVMSDSTEESS